MILISFPISSLHCIIRIVDCANACARSNNKNVRLSVATAILNTSSYMHSSHPTSPPSAALVNEFLDVIHTIVECGKYEPEPMTRSLVALGTVLLLPDGRGVEAMKTSAKGQGIASMLERLANSNCDDMAKAVIKEILSIL